MREPDTLEATDPDVAAAVAGGSTARRPTWR